MGLQTYNKKRRFDITSEPRGKASAKKGNHFVIQKHAATRLHYDLRLELDGVMKSWAVTKGPSLVPGEKRLAIHVEDHPIEYNKFEGTIPKGQYGGGTVMLWDRGTWTPEDDPRRAYAKGHLRFRLDGEKLHGGWHLVRMKRREGERQDPWLLIKMTDEGARDAKAADILEEKDKSVTTGRSMDEIATGKSRVWHSNREPKAPATKTPSPKSILKTPRRKARAAASTATRPAARARKKATRTAGKRGAARKSKKSPADPAKIPGARAAALPDFVEPCLATLHKSAPSGQNWVHEIKFDGYRLQARLDGGKVQLLTRRGLDWTAKFTPIADAIAALPAERALIDGEVVVEENGVSTFSSLQAALSDGRTDLMNYYAFDLLYLDGRDLTQSPLIARKEALRGLLAELPENGIIRLSDHFEQDGPVMLKHACDLKLEGIISKPREGPYRSGRHDDWVKTKCTNEQEFIVAGYGPSNALPRAVGSLVLAVNDGGKLRYSGRVGTGFTRKSAHEMFDRLDAIATDTNPFGKLPPEEKGRKVRWVKPQVVVEVKFGNWTADKIVRHGAFKGIREDKPVKEIVQEKAKPTQPKPPAIAKAAKPVAKAKPKRAAAKSSTKASADASSAHFTNPDRVYWPDDGVTKQNLADYYTGIWDWIAPELVDRPLSLVRCPDGIKGQCFYQKHVSAGLEGTHMHRFRDRDTKDFFAIKDLDGLLALVQAGVLEIHVWGCKVPDVESCDRIVFDLDPSPEVGWKQVIDGAREVRERLAGIGLETFIKTSGGKGLHIVLPIRGAGWDEAKDFAHAVALAMEADSPDLYVSNMAKSKRTGRIFVDYLRNGRGATSVVAYSTRARPGAAVSAPIRWEELTPQLTPDRFTLSNLPGRLARLKRDPWAGINDVKQNLPKSARRGKR